jgi:hypothetical protein
LLEKVGNEYVPISLPIYGHYNRIGAIDMIIEDENTNEILDFFQSKITSGEVKIDWEEVYWNGKFLNEIENIEQLIASIERGVTMDYNCVSFNNRRISYALIDYIIWDAITYFDFENRKSILLESDTWSEIYQDSITRFGNYSFEFKNVQDFLNKYNIKWFPPEDASQHFNQDVTAFLEEAKSKFKDEELVAKAIKSYEKELRN